MADRTNSLAIRLVVFVGILLALNLIFWLAGVHVHIDVLGSIGLTLLVTGVLWLIWGRRG
ncbi:MAG: hypothetical protein MK101_09370 [Phycisphaerales bacterium]|nr:hypothetical protein [Phycisphaerales bacterium]